MIEQIRYKKDSHEIDHLLDNIIYLILIIPFVLFLGIVGGSLLLKIPTHGVLMIAGAITTSIKAYKVVEDIMSQVEMIKSEGIIQITYANIGHLIYYSIVFTMILLVVKLCMTQSMGDKLVYYITAVIVEVGLGTIFVMIDNLLVNKKKNNVVVNINLDKENS